MSWLFSYADLISGALGIAASLILGYPAFRAIGPKRFYETSQRLVDDQAAKGDDRNKANAEKIARRVQGMQLSGAKEALICNSLGSFLLLLSFLFLLLAGIERRSGTDAEMDRTEGQTAEVSGG
ncbi:hypothetical protein [Sphingopyxis fribergensis]